MSQTVFKKCIAILKTSKSDNEILAALLTVTKVIKAEEADLSTSETVFDAVGTKFIRRLLLAGSAAESSDLSFKCVAASMLSCFCSVPGFVKERHTNLRDLLLPIASITATSFSGPPGDEEDEGRQGLVSDCYDCLLTVASEPVGRQTLIASGCVPKVWQAIDQKCLGHQRGLELLLYLSARCGADTWINSQQSLLELTASLAQRLSCLNGVEMFEICSQLSILMNATNDALVDELSKTSVPGILQQTLFHLLQNKLGQDQRARVLQLCAVMVGAFGVQWALDTQDSSHRLLLLMVHMACIEVRISLENERIEQVRQCESLLGVCYGLLERVIEHLTAGPSLKLDSRPVTQLHSAMVGAFNAVIQFLDRAASEVEQTSRATIRPVVVASVRVLGSWIAEETSALRSEVLALLPFLIEIGRETFVESKEVSSNGSCAECADAQTELEQSDCMDHSTTDGEQNTQTQSACMDHSTSDGEQKTQTQPETCFGGSVAESEPSNALSHTTNAPTRLGAQSLSSQEELLQSFRDVEVLQFLMPGLCHLTSEDLSRKVLLDCDLCQLLLDYLSHQWRRLQGEVQSPGNNKEPGVAMTTTCGVILNVLVTEAHLVHTQPDFAQLYRFVLDIFCKLSDVPEETVKTFVRASIELLKKAHSVEGAKTWSWHKSWEDYTDLWGLAVQVICECIPLVDWLPGTILSVQWPAAICKNLLQVTRASVPAEVATAHQELFLALVQSGGGAAEVLVQAGVLKVARKYESSVSSSLEAALR